MSSCYFQGIPYSDISAALPNVISTCDVHPTSQSMAHLTQSSDEFNKLDYLRRNESKKHVEWYPCPTLAISGAFCGGLFLLWHHSESQSKGTSCLPCLFSDMEDTGSRNLSEKGLLSKAAI